MLPRSSVGFRAAQTPCRGFAQTASSDQKGWLLSLSEARSDALPLASMWPCIILRTEVLESKVLDWHKDDLARIVCTYWRQHSRVSLHPNRLLREFKKELR